MQNIANQLPDIFTNPNSITKSHILAANVPIRINILEGQPFSANENKPHLKCVDQPVPKIKILEKGKGTIDQVIIWRQVLKKSHKT